MTKQCVILLGLLMLSGCDGCHKDTPPPPAATPTPQPAAQAPAQAGAAQDEDDCIVIVDANSDYGPPPLAVSFTSEAECTSGTIAYKWDFGDGTSSTEANPTHTYTKVGDYEASVTVKAGKAEASDEIDITVEEGEGEDQPGD